MVTQAEKFVFHVPMWAVKDPQTRTIAKLVANGATTVTLFTDQDLVNAFASHFDVRRTPSSESAVITIDSLQSLISLVQELSQSGVTHVIIDPPLGQDDCDKIYAIDRFLDDLELQLPHPDPDEDPVNEEVEV